jgi:hypothetical protein
MNKFGVVFLFLFGFDLAVADTVIARRGLELFKGAGYAACEDVRSVSLPAFFVILDQDGDAQVIDHGVLNPSARVRGPLTDLTKTLPAKEQADGVASFAIERDGLRVAEFKLYPKVRAVSGKVCRQTCDRYEMVLRWGVVGWYLNPNSGEKTFLYGNCKAPRGDGAERDRDF